VPEVQEYSILAGGGGQMRTTFTASECRQHSGVLSVQCADGIENSLFVDINYFVFSRIFRYYKLMNAKLECSKNQRESTIHDNRV